MKLIKYFRLYDKLRDAKLKPWEAIVAINELRKADPEILEEVYAWSEGALGSDLTIHGISFTSLTSEENGEGMQPHRAFLMLDWLKKEPEEAFHYLATYRFRQPMQAPTETELEMLNRRITELKVKASEVETPEVALPEPNANEAEADTECGNGDDIPVVGDEK